MDKSKRKRLSCGGGAVLRYPAKKRCHRRKSNQLVSVSDDISTETMDNIIELLPPSISFGKDKPLDSVDGLPQPLPLPDEMETEDKSKRINLCEDISTQILLRLPVKSILKLITVSKLWRSIVSGHRFRQIHVFRQHRPAATDLFFKFDQSNSFQVLPIVSHVKPVIRCFVPSVPDYHGTLTCASSCNGLLLLKSSNNELSLDNKYYVYNPTMDEYKILDLPPHITQNKYVCATLAFDPNESLHNKIIYKIIFLYRITNLSCKFWLEVYSSTTGTCKAPVCNPLVEDLDYLLVGDFDYHLVGDFDCDGNRGLFCNGAIHWLHSNSISITYFNVHTECINKLPTPCLNSSTRVRYFGESQGHLHLVNSKDRYFYKHSVFYVNELKRDYSGWFLKYKVELASILAAFPHIIQDKDEDGDEYYRNFISINQNGKVNDYCGTLMSIIRDKEEDGDYSTMVLVACGEWVEYNFKKKTTRRICKFMQPELSTSLSPSGYWFNIHQFIPTLAFI